MKYEVWLKQWLELFVKPTTKLRTYSKYKQQVRQYICPYLGNYEMIDITPLVLQSFVVELQKILSASSVNGVISVLKSSLNRAVKFKVCERQFSDSIIRPKIREKNIESFTMEEQKKIEHYILNNKRKRLLGIIVCLYTGLRIGELLALSWEDIDFNKSLINVSKNCHDSWSNGKYIKIIDTTKTKSSQRIIPVPKQILFMFKTLKKNSNSDYVIYGRTEYGAEVRIYQRSFDNLLKKLDIPHKGFHSLRHTFATRALECGMDVKTLSEILGHKNPTVTLNRYAHSMLEHKVEMMNRLGKLLK